MATLYPDGKGGYTTVNPATIINQNAMTGTGSLLDLDQNYSALNQASPYLARTNQPMQEMANVRRVQPQGFSSLAPSNQQMMEMANVRGQAGQKRTGAVDTPLNWKDNLLNMAVSPTGKAFARGLLEAGEYSTTPKTIGGGLAKSLEYLDAYEKQAADQKYREELFGFEKSKFDETKAQNIVANFLTNRKIDVDLQKALKPQLSNFTKSLLAANIDPSSPQGIALLEKELEKARTTIDMSTGDIKKEKLKYSLATLKEERKVFNSSRDLDGRLQIMEQILKKEDFETGFFEKYKMPFARAMAAAGILDTAEMEQLQDMEFFQAASSYMIPRMRAIGSGATSDFEIKLYTAAAPNISNTKKGNIFIVAGMRAINKFNQKKFREMEKWVDKNDSLSGFEEHWETEFGDTIFKQAATDDEFDKMVIDGDLKEGDLFLDSAENTFTVLTKDHLLIDGKQY